LTTMSWYDVLDKMVLYGGVGFFLLVVLYILQKRMIGLTPQFVKTSLSSVAGSSYEAENTGFYHQYLSVPVDDPGKRSVPRFEDLEAVEESGLIGSLVENGESDLLFGSDSLDSEIHTELDSPVAQQHGDRSNVEASGETDEEKADKDIEERPEPDDQRAIPALQVADVEDEPEEVNEGTQQSESIHMPDESEDEAQQETDENAAHQSESEAEACLVMPTRSSEEEDWAEDTTEEVDEYDYEEDDIYEDVDLESSEQHADGQTNKIEL